MDRRIKAVVMGAAFTVVAVGFAYAVPKAVDTVTEDPALEEVEIEEVEEGEPVELEPAEQTDTADAEDAGEHPENHGGAVSTAAHCDLEGKAHTELVQQIAHDKDATIASAEQACAEAVAAQEAAGPSTTQSKPPKPDRGGGKPEGDDGRTESSESDGDSSDDTSDDVITPDLTPEPTEPGNSGNGSGGGSGANGHGNGHSK
jgi:hypothetical protein